jgi:excisionase family DNA binding protein
MSDLAELLTRIAELDRDELAAVLVACAARLAMPVASTAVSSDAAQDRRNSDIDLLLVDEAAGLLRLAPSYVYELVRHKKLAALKTGKYVRIPRRSHMLHRREP